MTWVPSTRLQPGRPSQTASSPTPPHPLQRSGQRSRRIRTGIRTGTKLVQQLSGFALRCRCSSRIQDHTFCYIHQSVSKSITRDKALRQ